VPNTRIETRKGWIKDKNALFDAVQAALVEGLKIPAADRNLRLQEYAPEDFPLVPGKSERFTILEVKLFTGRSLEAKRNLYAAVARNLAPFGLSKHDIHVVLVEAPRENWGLQGKPGSEIELGFKVEV
jgi:phenylpyruvate tautomerase PptA (4-oxalocrotonate tautomerase family)